MKVAGACLLAIAFFPMGISVAADGTSTPAIENDALRVSFSAADASLSVFDKRSGLTWAQQASAGFSASRDSVRATAEGIAADVLGGGAKYTVAVSFTKGRPDAFDLVLDVPGRKYTALAGYPFHFAAPQKGWYYVQNTSGEGMLMPLDNVREISKPFGWTGSQPWWGMTDLKRSMVARLDSFRNPDGRPGAEDRTVFAVPLRINYAFHADGGYQRLAKEYRKFFLGAHPEMRPLRQRVEARPAVAALKDGVYVYLWGRNPAEDLAVVQDMKAAGIDRGIAVFYGRHEVDRALFDGIKKLGWVAGMYRMATGNLFQVSANRGWPNALLTGRLSPDRFFASSKRNAWDRVCAKHLVPEWTQKAEEAIRDYGVQLFYFDTLVVQLAPCLHPDHPSTIEENQQARGQIMRNTRDVGMLVGSGEGLCPTWALPDVDFFEGLMSLRPYADPPLKIPSGDYKTDLGDGYAKLAAFTLDESRRIPLYQLAFHDYVAGTWVWRDTNYQSTPYAWKKDLFNVLYGTMPMWHMTPALWESHKAECVASYNKLASVRGRIGFGEMLDFGWLTPDRSVQFTEWDSGDRVVVNFGDKPFAREGKQTIAARSFTIESTTGTR